MNNPIQLTNNPVCLDLFNRSALRRGVVLIALAWFALPSAARALTPPPDGGYPNANTAEGQDALFSLTPGPAR